MTLRIDASRSRFWFALLTDTGDGIAVEIWKHVIGGGAALQTRRMIEAPFHCVCDQIHDLLNELDPIPTANWGRGTQGGR